MSEADRPPGRPSPSSPMRSRGGGYLADRGLATALFVALSLGRPMLLEGEVGVGKTEVAKVAGRGARPAPDPAAVLRGHRHQPGAVRVGLRPPDAPDPGPVRAAARRRRRGRQAVRARSSCSSDRCWRPSGPATGRCCSSTRSTGPTTSSRRSCSSCSPTSRSRSPRSARSPPPPPPFVVLTSNRTRELHDALKRRCLYHWVGYPSAEREVEIVLVRDARVWPRRWPARSSPP